MCHGDQDTNFNTTLDALCTQEVPNAPASKSAHCHSARLFFSPDMFKRILERRPGDYLNFEVPRQLQTEGFGVTTWITSACEPGTTRVLTRRWMRNV